MDIGSTMNGVYGVYGVVVGRCERLRMLGDHEVEIGLGT